MHETLRNALSHDSVFLALLIMTVFSGVLGVIGLLGELIQRRIERARARPQWWV